VRLFVLITANNDGGYRIQLRSRLAGTTPDMQSRRMRSVSEAKHDAHRLFGLLQWQTREESGLAGQPYVELVADIHAEGGT
jgi:hypothetical protein